MNFECSSAWRLYRYFGIVKKTATPHKTSQSLSTSLLERTRRTAFQRKTTRNDFKSACLELTELKVVAGTNWASNTTTIMRDGGIDEPDIHSMVSVHVDSKLYGRWETWTNATCPNFPPCTWDITVGQVFQDTPNLCSNPLSRRHIVRLVSLLANVGNQPARN